MKQLCLNMIVKDESKIIRKTLENIVSYFPIDYYVICDTGSTDDTVLVIESFFKEKNTSGEIFHHTWFDFGTNRTLALQCARDKSKYLLIFDADDLIQGNFQYPVTLDKDAYCLKFGKNITYYRPLVINNQLEWKFIGILHEYLTKDNQTEFSYINGNYYIESGKFGNRSQDPQKYLKDAQLLEKAFVNETDLALASRYCFYCAQSYKDANNIEKSITFYIKTLSLKGWNQEKVISCLTLGNLYAKQENYSQAQVYWLKSVEYDVERIEGIVYACEYFQKTNQHLLVNLLYHKYKNYKKDLNLKLFLNVDSYQYKLEYYNSICAYYVDDFESGYLCCKEIIYNDCNNLELVWQNLYFYRNQIQQDSLDLFYKFNEQLPKFLKVEHLHLQLWNYLKDANIKALAPVVTKNLQNRSNCVVFASFTTCKRYTLFEQTIQSFIHHCKDIVSIDYWFCVDDNSSLEERDKMKLKFPWIDYYWKDNDERGHLISMNIIYNKLKKLQPIYWVHIEDDFLFYEHENYILKSILALKKYKISQILWNKNYAEVVEHYNIKGHKNILGEENFVLHQFINENRNYRNYHYWPDFSFRPSMILVDSILKVGNFDTNETFFERGYALKWYNNGYRSGFFNKICCLHIGKLTNESLKDKPNAYSLNNIKQF